MKKTWILSGVGVLLLSGLMIILTMCSSNGNRPPDNNNNGGGYPTVTDTNRPGITPPPTSGGINNGANENGEGTFHPPRPEYDQVRVESVSELIDWINTVNEDTFQGGRYRRVVTRFREQGKTLVPALNMPDARFMSITVLHDEVIPDGRTSLAYVFFIENERIAISISDTRQYDLAVGGDWAEAELIELEVKVDGRMQNVHALFRIGIDRPDIPGWRPFTSAKVLVDGFEAIVQQDRDVFREDVLDSLQFEVVEFES